ncbi:helix-turn-helix domain-containing protein [Sphingomonas sp. PR090111-T3T-6A]|uniref:helix-turn-helix domain-containing protein n=1 Tax=Sphingomonas sp. PR090111-T3T-6A TaxID=685778 RepID=UPI00037207F9|nr:helix-turn-helix transcriptional regulator [Sphingomonas sp. PR090111-T3T-6A]
MSDAAFDRLTEPQREALRLVARGFESKEIARILGISPYAVDTRVTRAVRILGATGRKEAARQLSAFEESTYEPLVYEPPYADIPPSPRHAEPDTTWVRQQETDRGNRMQEELALYIPPVRLSRKIKGWPFPTTGRPENDLSMAEIVIAVVIAAILCGVVGLGLISIGLAVLESAARFIKLIHS